MHGMYVKKKELYYFETLAAMIFLSAKENNKSVI
jgi:hypothetical protein